MLIGFGNSLEWLFSEINALTTGQSVSQNNLEKGGIEIWPSVDLGYCGPEIYEEVMRPNLSKRSWKNTCRNALGLIGESSRISYSASIKIFTISRQFGGVF